MRTGSFPPGRGNRSKKRLTARARWSRDIGWDYIKSIQDAGLEVDPADLPPDLEWEAPVWDLYQLVNTQWRINPATGKAYALDYNPAIVLMQEAGWDVAQGLGMLKVVEGEILRPRQQ